MIEECGSPRELAECMTRLPEGRYRVLVQRVRSRDEVLADFDRTTEALRIDPPQETANMTDDQILEWSDKMVKEVRRAARLAR